ncbi:MAG: BtpA/SgcQ family protein [Anaerolineaceae bacterium]|nr:BtpA/SgcQ family protein [Anaerolineaceae bacterium]
MTQKIDLFDLKPLVITALHLPELRLGRNSISMGWLEDYVLQNTAVFVKGGIPAVILQEETLNTAAARPENIAVMTALARMVRQEFPLLQLGIIVQAHDPIAPLAIAFASGADFVRIKVFVGAMLKAEGVQQGCGIAARDYRTQLGGEDIKILADVHDRTGYPLVDVPIETASEWAVHAGADSLILTGFSNEESLRYLSTVRSSGIQTPLLLGGGATDENVEEILNYADGVVISSALKRSDPDPQDMILWDLQKIQRFMQAACRHYQPEMAK